MLNIRELSQVKEIVIKSLPSEIDRRTLQFLQEDIATKTASYQKIVADFEKKYHCSLEEFERKIKQREIAEHPNWEESIEWGSAEDELQRTRMMQNILKWIASFLK